MRNPLGFLVITVVCGLWASGGQAQNWCLPGAQWHYGWNYFSGSGYVHYQYTLDTVYAGHACSVLRSVHYSANPVGPQQYDLDTSAPANTYTYAQNDTVYFYYGNFGKWLPAYFFNAQVGDTLTIPNEYFNNQTDTAVKVVVDTAGVMPIDTHALRYYTFRLVDSCWGNVFTGKVVERLGMFDNDLMPFWHCITDDYYYAFRCYSDNTFAQYPAGGNCNYLPTGIREPQRNTVSFALFPNPATNTVIISIPESLIGSTATVSDVMGRVVCKSEIANSKSEINLSGVGRGVYFVTVGNRTQKLIIQH